MDKTFQQRVRIWVSGWTVAVSASLCAATYTWQGGEDGAVSAAANWRVNGLSVETVPAAEDRIAVPAGVRLSVGAADAAWLASLGGADLAGELEVRAPSSALTFPAAFTLAGDGRFTVRDSKTTAVNLYGDNTAFTGLFHFTNSVVKVHHNRALGLTNPVEAHAGTLNTAFLIICAGGTYANSFLLDGGDGYFACEVQKQTVTFTGEITCTAKSAGRYSRIAATGNGQVTVAGGLRSVAGRMDFNGTVRLTGDDVVYQAGSYGFECDNGHLYIDTVLQPSNVPRLDVRGNNGSSIVFERENAFNGVALKMGGGATVDLNGFNQTMGALEYTATSGNESRFHSGTPAVLTMTGAEKNGRFGGYLTGQVSFTLNVPGTTLVMTNHPAAPSTTSGGLNVEAGTLTLGEAAAFTALTKLTVSGGTLSVAAGASVNRSVELDMTAGGTLALAGETVLEVLAATVGGTAVPAGTYSAAQPGMFDGMLSGTGSLKVLSMEDADLPPRTCTWTGEADDDLALPFNWTVDGETATAQPKAGDRLVIPEGRHIRVTAVRADWLASMTGADVVGELELAELTASLSLPDTFTLAGSGRFTVRNNPSSCYVKLYGDNTDFTGRIHITNACVSVWHNRALGVETPVEAHAGDLDKGFLVIRADGVYRNPMLLDGGKGYNAYLVESAVVTNTGLMTCTTVNAGNYSRIASANGGRVMLEGGVASVRGHMVFNGDVTMSGAGSYTGTGGFLCDAGTLKIETRFSPETLAYQEVRGNGTLKFLRENALNGVKLVIGNTGTVDLNGYDQTIGEMSYNSASGSEGVIHSETPAVLTLTGAEKNGRFGGRLTGAASFTLNAPGTALEVVNNAAKPSSTTGALTVRAGTLALGASAAFPALGTLSVSGGTLSVAAGAAVNPNVKLRIASGTLDLAENAELTVLTARVDGQAVPAGRYTAAAPGPFAGFLSGAGTVAVQSAREPLENPVVYTWTGAAGDGALTTPGNWANGDVPAFEGDDVLRFEGSGTVNLTETLDVYGLVFDGAGELTVTGAADARLLVSFGGVTVTNSLSDEAYAVTVNPSVSVETEQAWTVAAGHTLTLVSELKNAESLSLANTLTVYGAGTIDLQADNSAFLPAFDLKDRLRLRVCANGGLGSPDRVITVRALPFFYGGETLTNDVALKIYDTTYRHKDYTMNSADTPFVQRGEIVFANPNANTAYAAWNGKVRVEGGIGESAATGKSFWLEAVSADAEVTIAGASVTAAANVLTLDNAGSFVLCTRPVSYNTMCINKSLVRCGAEGVLLPTGVIRFSREGQGPSHHAVFGAEFGILDLNGYDQEIASLRCAWDRDNPEYAQAYAFVTSSVPASVKATERDVTREGLSIRFLGGAGFEQAGTGSVSAFSNAVCRTTGALRVSAGEIRLENGFVWGGSNTVDVAGGTLRVSGTGDAVFGGAQSRTKMLLSPFGRLALPDGETVTVHKLEVDGKPALAGLYGSASAPGTDSRYAAYFAEGTGVLRVRSSDVGGCCVIVR